MHSRGRYEPLTRDFKRIATAIWHCRGNRAATARQGPSFSGRQMEAGRIAAGSSRTSRLDPFSLPVRFEAADEAADERRRVVDLHRERVVVRRCVGGMRMALNLPVSAFRGVVIRLQAWGRVLGLPLLVAERDGSLREPFARIGALRIEAPTRRRRRRTIIARRRPSIRLRRRAARLPDNPAVYSGEREIIARN
jgi:hypothetical protein